MGLATALIISFVDWSSRPSDFLGKISYPLYLIHVPIGGRVINLIGRYTDEQWEIWGVFVLALVVSLFSAYAFNKFVE